MLGLSTLQRSRRAIYGVAIAWGLLFAPAIASSVTIRGVTYSVELAKTNVEHQRGLMQRARLGSRSGMLFIFPSDGIYAFWMKNTPIPLDIIWIGSNKQIAFIKRNAVPFSEIPIVPSSNARWVLEIRGGSSQANGFSIGDNVKINI